MRSSTPYLCPVCRRELKPTGHQNVPSHLDSIRADICPASGHPFRITIVNDPEQIISEAS